MQRSFEIDGAADRTRFQDEFLLCWESAEHRPDPVLIEWSWAFRCAEKFGCTGHEAASIQIWALNREASYLMTGRKKRFWSKGHG